MKEVSVFYLDEVNNAKDTLMAMGVLLEGLGRICEDFNGVDGLKEALYVLSSISENKAHILKDMRVKHGA